MLANACNGKQLERDEEKCERFSASIIPLHFLGDPKTGKFENVRFDYSSISVPFR